MSEIFNKLQVFVCLICLMQVVLVSGVAIRKKRNSNKHEDIVMNDQERVLKFSSDEKPQSCVSVLRHCKHNQECRETLKTLKAKCTIKSKSCNAGMHDLQACALVMDKINKKFLNLEEKCICEQHERRCSRIYIHIYDNPCFASVKYLRKNNQMPNTGTATSLNLHSASHTAPTPSRDFVEELLDSLLRNDDLNSSESVTSRTTTDSANKELRNSQGDGEIEDPIKVAQFNSHNLPFNKVSSEPNHHDQKNSSGDPLLLYIIIAVVGILVIMLLALGGGLILYFGWWRKEKNTKTTVMTK